LLLIAVLLLSYHLSSGNSLKSKAVPVTVIILLLLLIVTALTVKPQYITWAEFPTLLAKAQNGDAESQNRVGEMLLFGQGVEQNPVEAMKWFLKASEQGIGVAANHIGRLYLNGEGVKKNEAEACKWYKLAAERGDPGGIHNAKTCGPTGHMPRRE